MKKWIKIAVIVLSLTSLSWIIYLLVRGRTKTQQTIVPGKPSLTQTYKGKLETTVLINQNQFTYVPRLPFLQINIKPLTDTYARGVAAKLGFIGEPTIVNDSQEGTTYFWKNDSATIFIYLNSAKVTYDSGSSLNVVNKQLSDSAIISAGQDFLIKNGLLDLNSFSLKGVQYLKEGQLNEGFVPSTKDSATLYQVNISPKSSNYEIISLTSTGNANYLQITKDGNIYSLHLTIFSSVQNGATDYQLKNYDEIKTDIGNAVLISLGGEETPLDELSTDAVGAVNINKIDIAYLIDSPAANTLQPVYKLTGTATLTSSGNSVEAILYLPAISGL